jgi:hypothetical protein
MEQSLENTIALLSRTPAGLNGLLRDLPDAWAKGNEGEATWCVFDVLGHLISGERSDWMPRAKIILVDGESRTFEAFDRGGYKRECEGKTLIELLDEFARTRKESLRQLRELNLTPKDMERKGRHPKFGVVTLSQLLATWAVHDMTHLHQISRVLANQYREAVGPWSVFLGVLQCEGHSS